MHDTQRPPVPRDGRAAARWRETQLRRRLLEGVWQGDLEQRMREQVGTQRADAWGEPSLALNVFSNTVRELQCVCRLNNRTKRTVAKRQARIFPGLFCARMTVIHGGKRTAGLSSE